MALAVYLKRRLGPAPSSELLGDGGAELGGSIQKLSGPSAFQEGLSWPHSNLQPELGLWEVLFPLWPSSLTSLSTPGLPVWSPLGFHSLVCQGELEVWHPTSQVSFVEVLGCCELRGRPV